MPGPAITALHIADSGARWAQLGFSVAADGTIRIGKVTLRLGCAGPGGIVGWTLAGAGGDSVAGIPTERDGVAGGSPPEHPNTAIAVDHVVLATGDVDATLRALAQAGMQLRRERAGGSSRRPLRQAFFRHGEAILEVVGPAHGAAGAAVEDGALDRPRLWGLTVTAADLGEAARVLGDRLGQIHDAVQPGRRIASVRESAGLSVPLAFMSRAP